MLAAALAFSGVAVSPAQAADETAVQSYGGCLLGQRAGDLLILLDQSGSVDKTDPDDPQYGDRPARARGAKALVEQLTTATQQTKVDLQVRVAGFGSGYAPIGAWTSLTGAGASSTLDDAIDDATVTNGFETDYWSGLDGARRDLARRAVGDQGRCQALLWFTDGQFRLQPRTTEDDVRTNGAEKPYARGVSLRYAKGLERKDMPNLVAAEAKGRDDLCRTTGPANQLRAGGVTLLGIGLSAPGDDSGDQTAKFGLMKQIVLNQDGNCGSLRKPPGQFWPAGDLDGMLSAFDEIAHPAGQTTREFVLDDLLTSVHVRGRGPEGLRYALVSPGGERLPLPINGATSGQLPKLPGIDVRWTWQSKGLITVDLVRQPDAGWRGLWKVEITDASGGRATDDPTVSFTADLYPSWTAPAGELVSGGETSAELGLARAAGDPLPVAGVPGEVAITNELTDSAGTTHQLAGVTSKSGLGDQLAVDLRSVAPGPATVTSSLLYTTAEVGGRSTTLEPQTAEQQVTILPPKDRGEIIPPFAFGDITGPADKTAGVDVTGPSCVWVGEPPTVLGSPAGVDPVLSTEHNSPETCLRVDRGARATLQVRLTTAAEGNGALSGTVPVRLAPEDDAGRSIVQQVPFSAELTRRVDVGVAVGAFIVALLAGIGLPLAGLYLAKYLGAKIPGQTALEAIRLPVSVAGGDVTTDGRPLTLEALPGPVPVDLLRKGSRSVTAAGVGLQTRMGASPVSAGWVEAVLNGQLGASSASARPHGRGRAARLPLAVHNTWALFHDPAGPADRGTLLLLRGLDLTDADRGAQLDDARRRVPALLAALHAEGGGSGDQAQAPGAAPPSGWASGSFGTPAEDLPAPDRPAPPAARGGGSGSAPPDPGGAGDSIDWTQGGFGSGGPSSTEGPRKP